MLKYVSWKHETKISWLWQNAERILIIVFFATFTFNIRKVFLTPYSFLNGGFNEYTTISLSWADALMIAVILIYTIKYIYKSIFIRDLAIGYYTIQYKQ